MMGARHITVEPDDDGQRLDRWLKKQGLPFVAIQKIIRTGQVRIDGKRVKADTRLVAGQDVRLPPLEIKDKNAPYKLGDKDVALMKSLVLYDDGEIIAINKPAGIASQGGTNIERHIDGMLPALAGKDGVTPRLIHRLDRDTSGVLLLARSANMARRMGKIFAGRQIRKIYWALCAPAPEHHEGKIEWPIRKGNAAHNKDMMVVDPIDGQHALTLYEVVENAGSQAAFVAFWPRTGRTHQIRIHAAQEGFPLIGDDKYGQPSDAFDDMAIAPRLHLHAAEISFRHPNGGHYVTIQAPLAPDLATTWKSFGFNRKASASELFVKHSE
jgi:23S rRNA pseudouridine955/2504/2580 synthase